MNNSFIWVGVRVFLGCVLFYCMCEGVFMMLKVFRCGGIFGGDDTF